MKVFVFTGPTLAPEHARQILDATYLPPAAQGDVFEAARLHPAVIGIIDGYFHRVPSVWHKEILWAMEQGIHVLGSASIGALRAAELHAFGMVGTGGIFAEYADGKLSDDDEVAVIHGPPEMGFFALSEPMVNIRATLAAAGEQGVICQETVSKLTAIAKAIFFPDRSYQRLLSCARQQGVRARELASVEDWLPSGRIDRKRADAIEMLEVIRSLVSQPSLPRKETSYHLEKTYMFDE